ncbi:MAG: TIGR04283 family arsenosugar biosynthesis glycosyltransferase [Pirellulales bacterium]
MKVSVIIPTLNEGSRVASAIDRAWLAGANEVIVSDGGSRDDTVRVARRLACRLIQTAAGRAVQQNAAAAVASGDVLLFLHADTWLEAAAISQICQTMTNGEIVAGAFMQQIDGIAGAYRWLERGNAMRVRLFRLPFGDQGIYVRRDVFESIGRFPDVALMEDVRLLRRLRRRGLIVLLPGPLHVSSRRWQRHGVARQTLRNWMLLLAERFGVSPKRLANFYPPTCEVGHLGADGCSVSS